MQVMTIEDVEQVSGGFKYNDTNFGGGSFGGISGIARGAQLTSVGRAVTFSFGVGFGVGSYLNGAFGISNRISLMLR